MYYRYISDRITTEELDQFQIKFGYTTPFKTLIHSNTIYLLRLYIFSINFTVVINTIIDFITVLKAKWKLFRH